MSANKYHDLLARQIRRYFKTDDAPLLEQLHDFLHAVNDAYVDFDDDRALLDRSMELSSNELIDAIASLRRAEGKITRQNKYLKNIHEMTVNLMTRFDPAVLPEAVVRDGLAIFGGDDGFLALLDQPGKTMALKASTGGKAERVFARLAGSRESPGRGLHSDRLWILDGRKNGAGPTLDTEPGVIMGIPLKEAGALAGILVLINRDGSWTMEEESIHALEQFSVVVSMALENALLYSAVREELAVRRQTEERLKYLSLHDGLTGLFNRSCFEETMDRFKDGRYAPIAVMVCDIDGLKLINDTMGHAAGDRVLQVTTEILKRRTPPEGMLFRIGGDEFAMLLPGCDRATIDRVYQDIIADTGARHDDAQPIPLSVSIGYAFDDGKGAGPVELLKKADDNMYREKLHRRQSTRSSLVKTVMKLLEARDFITEGHAGRMQNLASTLATALGMPEPEIRDIRLLAQFHDIGKIGIPDSILLKPGPLTPAEIAEMHRHCEIGHRIAQSSPDLATIADWILAHHEWWNGNGYPLGLKGRAIPLACRIIAVVDAFDAMTSARPYRKPMTHMEAVQELLKWASLQFDPMIVDLFLQTLPKEKVLSL